VPRVALKEVAGPPGPPWERALRGTLDKLVVESERLAGNPLGDPVRRPLYVYTSPGVSERRRAPAIYVIQGFTGQLDMWFGRSPFEPTTIERFDDALADPGCPPGVLVFVDAWTSLGGSQFLNSPATGAYMDYLCDEVVPFVDARYPTLPAAQQRGIAGKSSGGYGAMVTPMRRPDVFAALASHAGDSLFEVSCLPRFPVIARTLRDHFDSSYTVFFERLAESRRFDFSRFGEALEMYAYACAYSPDPDDPGGPPRLPFELGTGRLVEDVWAEWLEHDPVRMISAHADALRSMRRIYLDAGRSDEAFLDLGAQAVSNELTVHEIEHSLELFDGRHGGIAWRYPIAVRELLCALTDTRKD
jgi:enterochelin esterase-like enzyme